MSRGLPVERRRGRLREAEAPRGPPWRPKRPQEAPRLAHVSSPAHRSGSGHLDKCAMTPHQRQLHMPHTSAHCTGGPKLNKHGNFSSLGTGHVSVKVPSLGGTYCVRHSSRQTLIAAVSVDCTLLQTELYTPRLLRGLTSPKKIVRFSVPAHWPRPTKLRNAQKLYRIFAHMNSRGALGLEVIHCSCHEDDQTSF